jgi:hypothetical protein
MFKLCVHACVERVPRTCMDNRIDMIAIDIRIELQWAYAKRGPR